MTFLTNVTISKKLPIIMIVLAILNAGIIAALSGYFSYKEQLSLTERNMSAVLGGIQGKLDVYLNFIRGDLDVLSRKGDLRADH